MKWIRYAVIFAIAGSLTLVLFKPFCNALFHCGCEAFWAAGGMLCNIHKAGVPHCPFCATGRWGSILPRTLILIFQAVVIFVPSRLSSPTRLGLGILVFIVAGIAIGFAFHQVTHYPAFL